VPAISETIRRFAEEPETFANDPSLPARLISTPAFTLALSPSPTQSVVSGVRTSMEGLDATIEEVRSLTREAGYTRLVWSVGPSSRPEGLAALLVTRGFTPATRPPFEPELTAMVLAEPPPPPQAGVEARLVRDVDEYILALRIAMEAFGESDEASAAWVSAAPSMWVPEDGNARLTHLAFLDDGRPVGFAFAAAAPAGLLLGGSGVLPAARGRGAYRALVAARWALATKLGKPALVIQAGLMSRPILERCGFEAVCRLDMLDDPTIHAAGPQDLPA
jgi:GNAT superfamily N-acetyltransferase